MVNRILFEGTRAVGVDYSHGPGPSRRVRAGEVILCGGAFNTPQTLQLSGVGSAGELEALGIPVVQDLPGVGEHLQDHLEVYVQHACTQPVSVAPGLKNWRKPFIGAEWLFFRSGLGATNHFEAGGFVRSNEDVPYPNLMFHFLPIAIRYDGSAPAGGHGYQVHIGPMYSDARGSVKVVSTDPGSIPRSRFNYLSTDQDRREWVEAIRVARSICPSRRSDRSTAASSLPVRRWRRTRVLDWVRSDGETALHPSCTCRWERTTGRWWIPGRCGSTASRASASWMPRRCRT